MKKVPANNRKPTALRKLEGNRSKEKFRDDEPEPTVEYQDPPDDLDESAVVFWHEMAPILVKTRIMTEVDYWAFANLCQLRSRIRKCREEIEELEKEGLFYSNMTYNEQGEVATVSHKKHPIAMLEQDYYQQYRMYAKEFGMTPVGRSAVHATDEENKDKKTKLF